MRRVLFRWRGIDVYAYPALLYVGAVCGIVAGTYAASLRGLDAARAYALLLLLLLPAMLGARLLFVAAHWPHYRHRREAILRRSEGGAALYGGLLVALALSVPLATSLGLGLRAFWDAAIVAILVGMVFTKLGCLLNGCCAGQPSDGVLALYLPNVHGVWRRRQPTQLAESALGAVLLLGAVVVWERMPAGGVALAVIAAYGVARWGLEPAREAMDRVGAVSVHRLISLVLVALCLAAFVALWVSTGGSR
jgi:prolipoprotein diacylglyceryltransferase